MCFRVAKSVQLAAGDLEKLIRGQAKTGEVELARQKISVALEPLVARMRAALNSSSPESAVPVPTAAPVNPAQSRESAAQLLKLLVESDAGAADFVEGNQAALRPLFAGESWAQFEKLVQNFEFADAQSRLETALKNLPVT